MKIQIASDLHLEFEDNRKFLRQNSLQPKGDILLLPGDIVPFYELKKYRDFFLFCSDHFESTYWVPGNHEYYYSDLNERIGCFKEEIEKNVYLVNNCCISYHGVQFVFSTLWSLISKTNSWHIQNGLSDYRCIKDGNNLFTVFRSNQLFEESLSFLKTTLASSNNEKCIVVTHHIPTFDKYPLDFENSIFNEAFATDLNHLISTHRIDYWIYGHHHRNMTEFLVGKTKLITNQLGYVKYGEHIDFKDDFIINV
ncbi:metallophosphoesterase [Elizabethkingia anophelis]|uniref:Ser/Thr protein phosphatase family protein n=2 Tax=Elizabethkingia anophelis TaxID=1117645 RepID=A0A455ZFA8_9FLAO|nr:metallophosphoesterase [Elizabethkingia anophelis]ATC37791.1 metallophosphoesterase [Elizabethkingia anophelis R26]ATC41471.1 metallophosphoesterase [Elizabethkingia anophelis Ag1]ATC45148.1 metallophosphoesterase [Elizabethkingia anophelis]ATC48824.1 metallophosphoesterase [Elizabethkingia anophelis]ELR80776.1 metallophosphoesterase [Elizabethkingia anophelis R26]